MEIEPHMPGLKVLRSYPQPDAPQLGNSARNRALAVFKYIPELNLEPTEALKHPLFKCIEHAFYQQATAAKADYTLEPSLVAEISTIPPKLKLN